MELLLLFFVLLVAAATLTGLGVDSRDGADWKPTVDGARATRWQ
jgi:hypothetical protein